MYMCLILNYLEDSNILDACTHISLILLKTITSLIELIISLIELMILNYSCEGGYTS